MSSDDPSNDTGPFDEPTVEGAEESATDGGENVWEIDVEDEPDAESTPDWSPPEEGGADEDVDPYDPPQSTVDPEAVGEPVERADVEIFSPQGIGVATFLGGPLAAVALMTYNFHEVGWEERVTPTVVVGLAATAILLSIGFALPNGTTGVGLGALVAAVAIASKFDSQIESRLGAEPRKKSNWTAAGFGCLSFIATMVLIFFIVLLFGV